MSKRKPAKKSASRKRGTKKKTARKSAFTHTSWQAMELEILNPLLQRQFVVGENVMVARIVLKKGCVVPMHSHHNEQISNMLEGALKFSIEGEEIVVRAGEVLVIPPHMPHKAEALVDSVALDIFNPPRADWINKTDQYLRSEGPKASKATQIVG